MSADTLNTTTYADVVANTANRTVLDSTKLRTWRQNVKAVVDQHATEINSHASQGASVGVHGATSAATASTVMARDSVGRAFAAEMQGNITGGILTTSDYFSSAFATGNAATSNIVINNMTSYLLISKSASGTNAGTQGMYLIGRQGTQTVVTTISADSSVSVTVDGSFKVVITNSSGASRSLSGFLIKVGGV